jgi:hypothetical protein
MLRLSRACWLCTDGLISLPGVYNMLGLCSRHPAAAMDARLNSCRPSLLTNHGLLAADDHLNYVCLFTLLNFDDLMYEVWLFANGAHGLIVVDV